MPRRKAIAKRSNAEEHGSSVQRRTRELSILNAIAEALNSAADVQQALERTLTLVTELLGLHIGWIWLFDADTDQFYIGGAQNLPPYLQEPVRMTGGSCWCIEDFRAGKLMPQNSPVIECSRLQPAIEANDTAATQGLRCHASIPLYFQNKPPGIMNVTRPEWRELTPDELRLLSTIGYQVGIAIERARLAEESTRLARAEEGARIAREIHDTLAQGLTAIGLHLEGAIHNLESNPERARQRLERALSMTRQSLEEARHSVMNLRAAPLAEKSLAEALGVLVECSLRKRGCVCISARSERACCRSGWSANSSGLRQRRSPTCADMRRRRR